MKRLSERYSVVERIGRGGVGDVYKGWQEALDRPVAIKVLRPEYTRSAVAVQRFEREARTTCRLHHPNVVTVFDVGIAEDGSRFLVMELLEGTSLATVMRERAALPMDEALEIARQIVRGMGAGEGVGLVHRDLKPENIHLVGGTHVKILDFGLATLLYAHTEELDDAVLKTASAPEPPRDETFTLDGEERAGAHSGERAQPALTNPHGVMGTPRYMPPEQVLHWGIDHRSDLYSFGCILFEMLAGRSPFEGPEPDDYMRQHLHEAPPDLRKLRPEVSPGLSSIVERLLQKSPTGRFQDWASLGDALTAEVVSTEEKRGALLSYPSGEREPLPTEPYRFLRPFSAASQVIFFGRDKDTERFKAAWEHVDRPRLVFLTGASGVGKTSFVAAKVVPALEHLGHRVLAVRGGPDPLEEIRVRLAREENHPATASLVEILLALIDDGSSVALLVDQVEEVLGDGDPQDAERLQAGLAAIVGGSDHRIRVLLSVREDFLGVLLRTLHPLALDELSRTVALRRLEADDIREALAGPGRKNVAVRYQPFRYESQVLDLIVTDLLADTAGEVAPRVQAVGSRLWEMVKDDPRPLITEAHYTTRLGGAQGILARTLDEAVNDLGSADQGIAKELLWALTHLPGSPTSRPAAESELVARAVDTDRRKAVLKRLEDRWRVVQGYNDPRWPDERSYRIAHESLIQRIQQYGQEGTERNRARQLFHHGLALWLQGGCRDGDVLSEEHFAEIQGHIEDLVLRTEEERAFYDRCLGLRAEGWMARVDEERRRTLVRRVNFALVPAVLLAVGFLVGQAPLGFATVYALRVHLGAALGVQGMALQDGAFYGADFSDLDLLGSNLAGSHLHDVDFSRAGLERASFRGATLRGTLFDDANLRGADLRDADLDGVRFQRADLRHATLGPNLDGGEFTGAAFDRQTDFGGPPPKGAFGPRGDVSGLEIAGLDLERFDLQGLQGEGVKLRGAHLASAFLEGASFDGADLQGADLTQANLKDATLRNADLGRARLDGALLCGADLSGARLEAASFQDAVSCPTTTWPDPPPPGLLHSER